MGQAIGGQGRRVLEALAAERRFRRASGNGAMGEGMGEGRGAGWAAGPLIAPASLIAELGARGLVVEKGDQLTLTEAGRRRVAPAPGPRLLAERPLPQDGRERARRGAAAARPARSVTVNLAESPLGWLKARGLVDARQFEAGERLRADFTVAGLGPRVTMRWEAAPRSAGPRGPDAPLDPTLAQIAAKRRMHAALDAAGSGLKDVLWRIVCAGETMAGAEGALGWPARSGRVVLTLALDRLADFYGLG